MTFLEQIQAQNAKLKKVDKETQERRKQEKNIGLSKNEQDDISHQLRLMLDERKKELQHEESDDENSDSDDDSYGSSDFD